MDIQQLTHAQMGDGLQLYHKLRTHIHLRSSWKILLLCLLLFSAAFTVYWFTGQERPNNYDYYVRLADAFLHGRLYLTENPAWLNELIPYGGVYYVVYPPFPAVIMTPIVALFGVGVDQTIVSLFVGSFCVVLAYFVAKDVNANKTVPAGLNKAGLHNNKLLWAALLFGFGTIFWWIASVGSVWLIAQVFSVFFLFLAIHEAFNKARPLLIGLLVGASFWCRLTTILGIFFFAGLIVSRAQGQNWSAKLRASFPSLFMLFLGAGVFVVLDMVYNFVRFGIPFDAGYWMIPGVLDEPWHSQGLFNLAYIPDNLRVFFFGLPVFVASAPYAYVPLTGLAIWFTTPAFIYTLRAKVKDSVTWSAWLAIFAIGAVVFTRALSGWGFGYRYAMDFYPFLYVLTVRGMGEKVRWHHILLLVIAILVNLWGTLAINQFNITDVNMPR